MIVPTLNSIKKLQIKTLEHCLIIHSGLITRKDYLKLSFSEIALRKDTLEAATLEGWAI